MMLLCSLVETHHLALTFGLTENNPLRFYLLVGTNVLHLCSWVLGVRLGGRKSLFEAFDVVFVRALLPSGHFRLTQLSSAFLQHTVTVQL